MFDQISPGVIYRAILLAFGLVVVILVFPTLASLILAVLIMVIVAIPLAACADFLKRWHVPRVVGGLLGLLLALAALGGLIALIVPVFSHEINRFVAQLPTISSRLPAPDRTPGGHLGEPYQPPDPALRRQLQEPSLEAARPRRLSR